MRVLISGAGIAGPTLAWWLHRYGIEATIVEKTPALRTGGYIVDFWGAGFDVAERMNLLEEIRSKGYMVEHVIVVDRNGKRVSGFPASAFARATNGRFVSLPRSELSALIFAGINGKVETIFGDSIASLHEDATGVLVRFGSGSKRRFDVVVGADGLHSKVRELTFGPETQFEKYLHVKAAAFRIDGYRPRKELTYVMYTEVGQQISRFSMRDDRTMFLFTFADPDPHIGDLEEQRAQLHKRFDSGGWESHAILDALGRTDDLYFDRVSQIRMDKWSRGRVALIGDAAWCVSLLAGQGTALAMTGAYVLAGELHRANGDHTLAFSRCQEILGPLLQAKQKAAARFAGTFAPKSESSIWIRNQVFKLLRIGWIADLVVGRDLTDRITLPDY